VTFHRGSFVLPPAIPRPTLCQACGPTSVPPHHALGQPGVDSHAPRPIFFSSEKNTSLYLLNASPPVGEDTAAAARPTRPHAGGARDGGVAMEEEEPVDSPAATVGVHRLPRLLAAAASSHVAPARPSAGAHRPRPHALPSLRCHGRAPAPRSRAAGGRFPCPAPYFPFLGLVQFPSKFQVFSLFLHHINF